MKNYPKIGIRPIIDGRWGGTREVVEGQAMHMAKKAQDLITSNLRYSDGTPVQCCIADMPIGGSYEAALCEEKFVKENVCATLSVTTCWAYGSETFDMNPHTIKAVWGMNSTERPGAVYLAAVMAAYAQKGLPAFAIYGRDVQDADDETIPEDVKKKLLDFATCAIAVGEMRNRSYVNFGSVSMGIAGSQCSPEFFQKYLGMRDEWVDMTEVLRRMALHIYDEDEYQKALAWIKENCPEGLDPNAGKAVPEIVQKSRVIPKDQIWEFIVKQYLIIRDVMFGNPKLAEIGWKEEALGRNGIAGGFQGQRMWSDWLPNADFTESILASTFDWNGTRPPVAFATENDTLNGVSMLFSTLLTHTAPCFHDVRTYWSPEAVERVVGMKPEGKAANGFIHLVNSGATAVDGCGKSRDKDGNAVMKPFWEMTEEDVNACLKATAWCPAKFVDFRGGGYSSHYVCDEEMPVTMLRVNLIDGLGPVMQIAEGYTCALPQEMHDKLNDRTDPSWPTFWFAPKVTGEGAFKDIYSVMANWGANHGVTIYGHVGDQIITLCSMLRIPVTMHNVEEERIFRPHVWGAFGTDNLEAADMNACMTYGPVYK